MLKQKTTSDRNTSAMYQVLVPIFFDNTRREWLVPGTSTSTSIICMITVVLDFSNSNHQHVAKLSGQDVTLVDCVFVFVSVLFFVLSFSPSSMKSLVVVFVLICGCINLDGSCITLVNCLF